MAKVTTLTQLQALAERTKNELDSAKGSIPTKVSQLTNDSAYITKAVSDLTNYYTKSNTYTKTEVDNKVSAIPKFAIAVVSSLPTSNISSTTIYLVTSGEESQNLYDEYIYVNSKWEKLGTQTVDLSGYVQKEAGKGLSTNDYTTTEKNKLAGITAGATKVEASSTNGKIKINGTDTTVYTLPSDVLTGSVATDTEVTTMLNTVFGE
jgi:hypothetical protein